MKSTRVLSVALLAALAVACSDGTQVTGPQGPQGPQFSASESGGFVPELTGRYLILGQDGALPADLEEQVQLAGGRLTSVIPEIGVAFAESDDANFQLSAARMRGIEAAAPDMLLQWTQPMVARGDAEVDLEVSSEVVEAGAGAPLAPSGVFYPIQWAPGAIGAPAAWAAGYTGEGVRIAILDGGIRNTHVDLAANMDNARSASFVPGQPFNNDVGTFWHGTHVAGIAAASGAVGVMGIAPRATIVGVKVLHSGTGSFEWVINGIVYAARPDAEGGAGADIINLSLGATLDGDWKIKAYRDAFHDLVRAIDRATRYAYEQGTLVIASAGNDATNYDLFNFKELFKTPAQNHQVVAVSATGPHGWAAFNATDFHRPAYYTDHGKSLVSVGAPGGTVGLFVIDGFDAICVKQRSDGFNVTQFCETFDMVFSTTRGSGASNSTYGWAQGTSMAAPAAAGVAALIMQANGRGNPGAVRARLQRSALDLGKRGRDEWYGMGWVNAAQAVGLF